MNEAPPFLTATGSGGTINWYDSNPNSGSPTPIGTGSPFMPPTNTNNPGTTTYWVTQSNALGCESQPATVVVTVNQPPGAPGTDQMVNVCVNDPAPTLSASGSGGVFNWYNADPSAGNVFSLWNGNTFTPTLNTSSTGSYSFWVSESDAAGCEGPATMLTITVNPLPSLVAALTNCAADLLSYSVDITLNNANNIMVSEGSFVNNGVGSFTVTGVDVNNDLTVTAINTSTGCSVDIVIPAPNCLCPTILPPSSNGNVQICVGDPIPPLSVSVGPGETADWYSNAIGGTLLAQGTTTFTPPGPGTYYAETVQIVSGCSSSSRTAVSLTLSPLPALIDFLVYCSQDLSTYTIEIVVSNANVVTASDGDVVNDGGGLFVISNIDINVNISVLASNSSTGCFNSFDFDAPECNCPNINAPVSNGPVSICAGDVIPPLTVTVGANQTVDWYNASTGGTLLLAGSTSFTPTVAGTYYAETRDISTGCLSDTRTSLTLTISPVPVLTDTLTSCAADLLTYSVSITVTNADILTVSEGTVTDNGGGSFTISGIDINNDLVVTAMNSGTSCSAAFTIAAPDCNCPDLDAPVSAGDEAICAGDALPVLSVSVGAGLTVDWYNSATGGILILEDSQTFTPANAGTFYAETREITTGCVSATRTPVMLTINPLPVLDNAQTSCAPDLLSYTVTVSISNADNIVVSEGSLVDNGGGSFTIADININNNLIITANNTITSCNDDFTINFPDCNCPNTLAPVSNGNIAICAGETLPALSVTVGVGETADWYDSANGGLLLLADSPSFTPTAAGTYYAETREINSGCLSPTRTPVTLTINPLPTLTNTQTNCAADLLTYSVTVILNNTDNISVSEGSVTDNGGGSFTITGVPVNNDLMITASNAVTTCTDDFIITAPDCSCGVIDAPVSAGDVSFCTGDAIPALSVSVGAGETVDWYDATTMGTLLLAGSSTYTPATVGTYYAETREINTGCLSATRTAVTLTMDSLPTLASSQTDCALNLQTYSVTVTFADADNISVSEGTIVDNGGGSFTINGIDTDNNLMITAGNAATSCTDDFIITAPDCSCPVVDPPVSDGDLTICGDEVIPILSVTVGPGETVNWYDAPVGGILLLSNSTTFEPTVAGTYYAQTRVIVSGCLSATRTPVTLTIHPAVVLLNGTQTDCADDLLTYSATVTFLNADNLTVSEGTVTDNGGGSFTVSGITVNNDLMLTAINTITTCSADFTITAPDCPCPVVNQPVNVGDLSICEGEIIPALSVTVGAGETVDWYDAAAGGTLLLAGSTSFTPSVAGTYHAETRNLVNGCVSDSRTPVTFTINELPGLSVALAMDPLCGLDNGSITLVGIGGQAPYEYQIDGQGFSNNAIFNNLAAASFSFEVRDDNGCLGTIDTSLAAPVGVTALANVTDTLTCATTSVTLDGNQTTSDGTVTYEWIFNGAVISTQVTAQASEPGMYILNAIQDACSSADTIFVAQNLSPGLEAVLQSENQLDCNITSATLDGTASSSGGEISYAWYLDDNVINGAVANTYEANTEGSYILVVTDEHTGCFVSDTLVLLNNENYPVANAGEDGTITCVINSILADGSGSQSGPSIVYQWFDPTGNPVNGANQNTLSINAPGAYSLMVQDTTNGCFNTDEMIVSTDLTPPVADAGEQMQLDCNETTLPLNGQGSSTGGQYSYEWSTEVPGTGIILSGTNTLSPLIGGPGNYYLTVTNNNNGCTASDATFVTEVTTIPTDFNVFSEDAGCYGESNGFISIAAQNQGLQILYAFDDQPFSSNTQFTSLPAGRGYHGRGCQWLPVGYHSHHSARY